MHTIVIMVTKFSKLREKEVINICNGKRIGCVSDIELDLNTGRVLRLVIPKSGKCFGFSTVKNTLYIPWQNIEKIGDDTILVRYAELTP